MTLYLVIIQPQRQSETFCAVAENDSTWSSSTQIKSGETIGQMEKGNATSWGGKRGERKRRGRGKSWRETSRQPAQLLENEIMPQISNAKGSSEREGNRERNRVRAGQERAGAEEGQCEHKKEWESDARGSFKAFCVVSGPFLQPQSQAKNTGGITRGCHRARGRFANQILPAEERRGTAYSAFQLVDSSGLLREGEYKT